MSTYRIKTEAEFNATCKIDSDGDFMCGESMFNTRAMGHLYGVHLTKAESDEILKERTRLYLENGPQGKDNGWSFTKEMIVKVTEDSKTTQLISRKKLQSIHNVACSTWKSKIEEYVAASGPFDEKITLTNEQVNEMFKASDSTQKAILTKAGLVEVKSERKYAKIEARGSADNLVPLVIGEGDDRLEILIGAGIVENEDFKRACLIPVSNRTKYVPEILWNVEGRDWTIVFKKK
jgi:hypothetical protein